MSEAHSNTATRWLAFFFVCFAIAIFGIGLWAAFNYNVQDAQKPPGGGGHGMILPMDGDYAPHAAKSPIS